MLSIIAHTISPLRPTFFYCLFYGIFFKKIESGGQNKNKILFLVESTKKNKNKIGNRAAYFYFSENLFLRNLSAIITNIIDTSSVSINIHCYLSAISSGDNTNSTVISIPLFFKYTTSPTLYILV